MGTLACTRFPRRSSGIMLSPVVVYFGLAAVRVGQHADETELSPVSLLVDRGKR